MYNIGWTIGRSVPVIIISQLRPVRNFKRAPGYKCPVSAQVTYRLPSQRGHHLQRHLFGSSQGRRRADEGQHKWGSGFSPFFAVQRDVRPNFLSQIRSKIVSKS